MLTKSEANRIARIKSAALRGDFVSPADKQWILDVTIRESVKVPKQVKELANKQGYQTAGLQLK